MFFAIIVIAFCPTRLSLAGSGESVAAREPRTQHPSPHETKGDSRKNLPQAVTVTDTNCYSWTRVAPLPLSPTFGAAATSDGKSAYVAGGLFNHGYTGDLVNEFVRYNLASNTWTVLAPMPDAKYFASAVYSPINDKVYVFGGVSPGGSTSAVSPATRIYDIATDTWSSGAAMPAARAGMAAGYHNGKIYLAGGGNGIFEPYFGTPQANLWEYDPIDNVWNTSRPSMPEAKATASFGIINGHFYVVGGVSPSSSSLSFTIMTSLITAGRGELICTVHTLAAVVPSLADD